VQHRELAAEAPGEVRLGVAANWQQFCLLILINAFVGGMVGLERTIVPLLGPETFHVESATVVGSFVISFGIVKAISDASHPTWRARSLSVYRFWRDSGYAIGALIAGIIGDLFGLAWAIAAVAILTFVSGAIVAGTMKKDSKSAVSG
jgi:MFS family permease